VARFDRTIPPGGEGKITLEVKTKGLQGSFHKTARVFSNDPKKRLLTIGMKGKIWTPIHMKPRHLDLAGYLEEKIERIVHLRGEKKEPLIIKLASVSIPDKVAVELKEIEKGRDYQLKVKNKVEKKTVYTGQVKLTTNYPEKSEIVIGISGHIKTPVEVRPKVLKFGRMSDEQLQRSKRDGRSMGRWVTVTLNKGNDLKIEKVELERSLFEVVNGEMPISGGMIGMIQLTVEPFLEKLRKGPNTDRLKIYTNQKDNKVLEVPISFEVF
jgi:hypothetical protein